MLMALQVVSERFKLGGWLRHSLGKHLRTEAIQDSRGARLAAGRPASRVGTQRERLECGNAVAGCFRTFQAGRMAPLADPLLHLRLDPAHGARSQRDRPGELLLVQTLMDRVARQARAGLDLRQPQKAGRSARRRPGQGSGTRGEGRPWPRPIRNRPSGGADVEWGSERGGRAPPKRGTEVRRADEG